jgi:hypothetical protein
MTVQIGTTEQFTDLHRAYDVRFILNGVRSKGMEQQAGIKHLTGFFKCAKTSEPALVSHLSVYTSLPYQL